MSWSAPRFSAKARSSTRSIWPCNQPPGHRAHDGTDLSALERTTIAKVLQECRGNKSKAARRLGVSRTQLHLRVRKYGLEQAATA